MFGFSTRLAPAGPARAPWAWPLLFAPLWGTLFVAFGLGPVVSRTADWGVPAANTAIFIGAALLFRASPLFATPGAARASLTREFQAARDDEVRREAADEALEARVTARREARRKEEEAQKGSGGQRGEGEGRGD